ncbi:MAG: restriction endonuclease subunit M [Methylococcales bacterium]|nr:restriction endonuclease subunit M [Methylococcales bacterium]MBT7410790.1 restriction endonuclease subunit M [Methylococcales bacterium]
MSLPDGWDVKKLGDVCDVIAGQSPQGIYYNNQEDGLPFYQGKKEFTEKYIGEPVKWTTKITKKADKDDILMSVRAPVGPINFATQKICIGRGLASIRAGKLIDKEFLYNFLLKHENEIIGNTGAVFNSINKTQIGAIQIPLPLLDEQQRIIEVLDKAFTAIDKAKQNAEQNLRNAKELFESYLSEIFENHDLTWKVKALGEIAKHSLGKMLDKNKNKGIKKKYLRNQSVRWFDFDLDGLTEMRFLDNEKERYTAIKGDVLICEGGYPGRAAIWQNDYPIYFQKAIHRVRFSESVYGQWFLYYLFLSDRTGKLKLYFTGTGIQHFTGASLDKFIIPIPPINVIKILITKIDNISSETKKLESIYQQKLDNLTELKKSILQKAFAGELTQ